MSDPVTVFTALKWTSLDEATSIAEGWGLFDVDSTGVLEIQACHEGGNYVFMKDSEARTFVSKRAVEGSSLHLKALCMLAQQIVDSQLHTCCDERDVASDIETAQGLYNLNGSCCNNWQVDITSQLTILRSTIG